VNNQPGRKDNDMKEKLSILIIVGTVRQNRVGRKVADWYLAEARRAAPQIDFSLLDAAELNLPMFDEPLPPRAHKYSPVQEKLAALIGGADGFVVVTGEYNHSIPGSLKNLFDYVLSEWDRKAAACAGYGTTGGIRALEHVVQVFNFLGVAVVRDHVHITGIREALDENGVPRPGSVLGDIPRQLKNLEWWARTLKAGRQGGHV
jgi:NAD(P)H-dependent FMN reductase